MKYRFLLVIIFLSSIVFGQNEQILKTYTQKELLEDYDLMVSSLKEGHAGLYWYTSYPEYEKIFSENRNKIKDNMNSFEFFRIISRVVAADREGHSQVRSSKDIGQFIRKKGRYLPFAVKVIGEKCYVLNDINGQNTKGFIVKKINGASIENILKTLFNYMSRLSDGYTTTGKYELLNRFGLAGYYLDFINDFTNDKVSLELENPDTKSLKKMNVNLLNREELVALSKTVKRIKRKYDDEIFKLEIDNKQKTATLTFNDFGYRDFEKRNLNFKRVVDSSFQIIFKNKIKNLIIDIRNNSGGSEGAEDYLFSYLTNKKYTKYKYVESKGFTYSFLDFTDYKDHKKDLEDDLKKEHYLASDGRYLRRKHILPTELPQKRYFKGNIYLLISGRTYSGGSEFASIVRSHSNATIIGQETGGGFYGQTSGFDTYLKLPNSNMEVRIPLLKFVTNFESDDIPFGRGVPPHHTISPTFQEYLSGKDVALDFAKNLIEKSQ